MTRCRFGHAAALQRHQQSRSDDDVERHQAHHDGDRQMEQDAAYGGGLTQPLSRGGAKTMVRQRELSSANVPHVVATTTAGRASREQEHPDPDVGKRAVRTGVPRVPAPDPPIDERGQAQEGAQGFVHASARDDDSMRREAETTFALGRQPLRDRLAWPSRKARSAPRG